MFLPKCLITIGEYIFDFVCDVKITSNYETLTDTAKIIIPKKLSWKDTTIAKGENSPLKRGMKVEIKLGKKDGTMNTEFVGYITKIGLKTPLELECEDAMWFLKQTTIAKLTYSNVNLSKLLKDILPAGTDYQCKAEVNLGQFRISKATPAMVLDELKKTYNLYSFFRNGKLYVGQAFWQELKKEAYFNFQENIISNDLSYEKGEDVRIKVKAISMLPNNKKIEVEDGDSDGATRTLHYYNKSQALLREIIKEDLRKLKYTGFRGKFTAQGYNFIQHGDYATLSDKIYEDRNGTYRIKGTEVTFGMKGFQRTIEIDQLVK